MYSAKHRMLKTHIIQSSVTQYELVITMHSDAAQVLTKVDSQRIADLTLDLVKIPSPTGQELEVARFYASELEKAGLDVRLDYLEAHRPNVIAILHGKGGGRNLILAGHLDTIPQYRCVQPGMTDGKIYGRGTSDMKGSLAAMAECAKALARMKTPLNGDLILIGWVDHEAPVGRGLGPKAVAKSIREGKIRADAAVVTEGPSDGSVGIAQGGMAVITVRTSSPKGTVHTTTVPLRSNPIVWIAEAIREIGAYDQELNSKPWNPLIPERPSVQLGIFAGGDFYNRLPAECSLTGTVRWDPGETVHMAEAELRSRLSRLENTLGHSLDESVKFRLEMDLGRESYEIPRNSEIVKFTQAAVKEVAGNEPEVTGTRSVGDPPILNLEGGIPTVHYGPTGTTAHSDNECVSVEALTFASKVYVALALRFCA